jgi:putative transport protein
MAWLHAFLEKYPELVLFLTIGIGHWIGARKFGHFKLGPVTGSLFAGLAIGQLGEVPVSAMAKSFLFLLFLFGIGYSVGPQFMQALRRDGLKPVALAVVVCVTGLATAVVVAKTLDLDPGFAAGLLSGALTESPAMGTAIEAINALPLSAAERARLTAHVPVADAVTYVFGAAGCIWFCTTLGPKLLGIDLETEAKKLEAELGIDRARPGVISAWRPFEMRAFRLLPDGQVAGKTIAQAEALAPEHRLFVQRVRRGEAILEYAPDLVLQGDDIVAVSGQRAVLVSVLGARSAEIEDRALLDMPVLNADIMLTNAEHSGRTLGEFVQFDWSRSLFVQRLTRGGEAVPVAPGVDVQRGDVLRVSGPELAVLNAARHLGPIVQPTDQTDFVVLGIAIFLGGLLGVLVTFPIGGMHISLSTSVGTLLAGLLVGHLRSTRPLFARIPDGAVTLMTSLGLAAFVAMTGLHAGPIFFTALKEAGIGLFFGGMVVTLVPQLVGLFFGYYVLRMNPLLVLGGISGAQTMTAAMAAVQERSKSPVAVLGYTPAVPIGHILLTTWGTVIVGIMAR